MQSVESPWTSPPRFPGIPVQALSTKHLRDVIADSRVRWPWRVAAGEALVEQRARDEWAMDAYTLLGCESNPELRCLAVRGLALEHCADALDTILEILAAEATRATPDVGVALTALHAIDGYSMLEWRDASIDLRAVLNAWIDHPTSPVQAKAHEMLALLDPWGTRCR